MQICVVQRSQSTDELAEGCTDGYGYAGSRPGRYELPINSFRRFYSAQIDLAIECTSFGWDCARSCSRSLHVGPTSGPTNFWQAARIGLRWRAISRFGLCGWRIFWLVCGKLVIVDVSFWAKGVHLSQKNLRQKVTEEFYTVMESDQRTLNRQKAEVA